jgi:peptide/nickel transport system substrate-binding protein
MSLRDRGLIAVLSLSLVLLSVAAIAPSLAPAREVGAQPSALTAGRPYVEGVLGHATNASPFGARSSADRELVSLLFRGLVRLGPDGTVVPDLATRWEVDQTGSQWTFHLRPGLTWQDGQPLTSDDVVFTVQTLNNPDYTGPGADSWREVTASAPDPLTVVLTLATPLGGFLDAATQPIAPAHLLANLAPADIVSDPFGQHPIGSGPFQLVSLGPTRAILEPANAVSLAADGGPTSVTPRPTDSLATPGPTSPTDIATPYLAGIEFLYYDDADALRSAWDRGELDAASGLSPADAATLGATPGARLLRYPSTTLLAVDLNLRPSRPEFGDPTVRKALLAAIDRDTIVAMTLAALGTRADSLIPPSSTFYDSAANPVVKYGQAAARAGLAKAGWKESGGSWIPKGGKTPLTIVVLSPEQDANPVAYAVAAAVVADWAAIGLNVRQVAVPASQPIGDRLRSGVFQAAVVPLVIGLDPDLYPLLASTQTRTGGSNVTGLQDPGLDSLLIAARAPGTDLNRLAAYKALEARLSAGLFILPIAFRDEVVVLRDTVSGPTPRPIGAPGDRFWDVLTWRLADGR